MADTKKKKNQKNLDYDQKKTSETAAKKVNVADAFLGELKDAFSNFNKIPESHRLQLYGDQKYLDQFREYFKKECPNLLDKIDQKDLPLYIQVLENKGFSLATITKDASKLDEEFKSEDTERHVMEKSLSHLRKFCENKSNNMPDDIFKKFADAAGFTYDKLVIDPDGQLKTVDTLYQSWKDFLKEEGIKLSDTSTEHIEHILMPDYNPTARIMVTVALTKIRKELKGALKTAFDARFPSTITIFSSYQDLINFKLEWKQFLDDHASEIDESLAKKLDSIMVYNSDIQQELLKSGRKFDDTKGFSEWEQYFRRIFNKLVTRQLFDEVQKNQDCIDHYVEEMGKTFIQFPPYVNDIFTIYRFNSNDIASVDSGFLGDLNQLNTQIAELTSHYESAKDTEKQELRAKIKTLKHEKEQREWQGYIAFLKTKDAALAEVFSQLVTNNFDFSTLSADQQQLFLYVLVKNKLEDTIKNKVPELLSVKEEELSQFIHDLFDLKKMDLVIPTRHGPVPLHFLKKEFMASTRKTSLGIGDVEDIKNLPLNFVTQLTEGNAAFFEESDIFNSIYTDFAAKNGKFRFNDAYKVRIKKNGKIVEGYLSSYAPLEERNVDDFDGKELYLYSQPITAPSQERELVKRPHDAAKTGVPVVIKDAEQQDCEMEILDKHLNLNGDAFGALLFGYVLGQQSMNTTMSPEKEKELEQKLGDLTVYKDKEDGEKESIDTVSTEMSSDKGIETPQDIFKKEWKDLGGYQFLDKEPFGFVEGTRLFIPFTSSEVPPIENGNAWLQMEITHINTNKGTFTVRIRGGELSLGKSEGVTKELPISTQSLASIRKSFGNKIYKLPNLAHVSFTDQMNKITEGSVCSSADMQKYFGSVEYTGSTFQYTIGNYKGKEVTHFGLYQPKDTDENVAQESGKLILYKIKKNVNGTFNVSGDSMKGNYAKNFPARDMDYTTFMLFVKEKGLQPKCKEQIQDIDAKVEKDKEVPTKVRGFSINNVIGFFKNGLNKVKDGLKKYDEERTEDLTDLLTSQGQLWGKIGGFLSPFGRVSSSFESMGMEYFLERDNRIWKKVEKRTKFYEDFDYTALYVKLIEPMLKGTLKIVPHYKIAAILLVHLKKGKGPYAKYLPTAEGQRIGQLLGKAHQQRYRAIREKRIRDLEQNAHLYPVQWADQVKNELVELEMRYIVHVMDGRHLGHGDDDKLFFQKKYSKKFCDELETAYTGFFKQGTVEEGYSKIQETTNFEFAAFEYFRQLADRPQQALPHLKVMATKAINTTQWEVFESAVLAGILSGVFLNMTYAATQSFIQKICRTRGFIPGLFVKDIKQQHKIQRLLDLFSGNSFSKDNKYSPDDFSFRQNKGPKQFVIDFKDWIAEGSRRHELSKFLSLEGVTENKSSDGKKKTLLDLHSDVETKPEDKLLLEEYIGKTNEKNEELDHDVEKNTSSLTGSILTKSQSVVDKMIRFDQGGFAGKDGDEIQNMRAFCTNMQDAIPTNKLDSSEQTKFYLKKFFNRFGERGFSGSKMTDFLKRLKWCNDSRSPKSEVDDVLYYSVVGEIVSALGSHNAPPPIELQGALGAWKDFFKNNLDTILQSDVIVSCFGGAQYKTDYDKSKATLHPREEASLLLDREDSNMYMFGLSKEEKAQASLKKRELVNENKYLNKKLYDLAYDLSRRCGFPNRFKKEVNAINKKKSLSQTKSKSTGAKINNPEVIEQVKQILEGKQPEEEDDFIPQSYDPYLD